MSNEIMLFKNKELEIELKGYISDDNQVMVNVEAIARGVKGKYIQVKNNKEYLRLTNIKADLDKFGFPIQSGKDFIPESAMYLLIMNGDGEVSRKFQMWLATEVLPSIRKHGAYIGDGEIDEEYIDNKVRFSEKRTINTFANSNVDDVKQLVKEFKDYTIDLDTKTRVTRCNSSIKGLQRLHDKVAKESTLNIAECYKILQYIDEIKKIKHEAENRHRGQKIGHRNRKINELTNELEKVCPTVEEFIECKTAPISNNVMYEAVSDWNTGEPKMVRRQKYLNWLRWFDDSELEKFADLDFSKPIWIHCKYIMSYNQDVSNFIKPLFDKIASYFGVDDRLFIPASQEVLGYYNNVKDGRIYLYMTNEEAY